MNAEQRIMELQIAYSKENHEIEQILGKALGYPWFKDDQKNFPDATEVDGVCIGDHVPATLAMEAARWIAKLSDELATARETNKRLNARCQLAESALPEWRQIEVSKFVGGSLGRAFLAHAVGEAQRQNAEALAELARFHSVIELAHSERAALLAEITRLQTAGNMAWVRA